MDGRGRARWLCVVMVGGAMLVEATPARPAPPAAPVVREAPATQAAPAPVSGYGWPLPGLPRISRYFTPPEHPYGPGHRGVDLVAAAGSPVHAAGTGTVVFAGALAGRGVVSVQHPDGLRTTYEPVAAGVAAGEKVTRGQLLGTLQAGHAGCVAAACLHWGVRRARNDYLDPLRLIGHWPVRLVPWR